MRLSNDVDYREEYDKGYQRGRLDNYLFGMKSILASTSHIRGYADGYIDGYNSIPTFQQELDK